MNIENFNYLLELDKYRSISQASKNLFISSQQLSRILASIEREYNIQIFERLNTGLRPTPEGMEFIKKAASIIKQNNLLHEINKASATNSNQNPLTGTLNIYSPSYAWNRIIQCITTFAVENPQVNITHTIEAPSTITSKLLYDQNAVGFNLSIEESINTATKSDFFSQDSFSIKNLASHTLRVYCADHHPLAAKAKLSL